MKKRKILFLTFFFLLIFVFSSAKTVRGQTCQWKIDGQFTNVLFPVWTTEKRSVKFEFNVEGVLPEDRLILCSDDCSELVHKDVVIRNIVPNNPITYTLGVNDNKRIKDPGVHTFHVRNISTGAGVNIPGCEFKFTTQTVYEKCEWEMRSTTDPEGRTFTPLSTIYAKVKNFPAELNPSYVMWVKGDGVDKQIEIPDKGLGETELGRFNEGQYLITLWIGIEGSGGYAHIPTKCSKLFIISKSGGSEESATSLISLCDNDTTGKCVQCFERNGIWTALGCIVIGSDSLNDFVGWVLSRVIFVASGIAFLLMVYGAIQIITSSGSPDQVKAGKELITGAVAGLILIILTLFILRLIGVDILHIPGFSS